jgi:hypothetical protein
MPTITGFVYNDAGQPAPGRKVRAYRRDTGEFLFSAVSSDGLGSDDQYFNDNLLLIQLNGTLDTVNSPAALPWTATADMLFTSNQSIIPGGQSLDTSVPGTFFTLNVNTGVGEATSPPNYTFEAFIYPKSSDFGGPVLYSGNTLEGRVFGAYADGLFITENGQGVSGYDVTHYFLRPLNINQWNHIAFTRNSNQFRAFVNGVQASGFAPPGLGGVSFAGNNIGLNIGNMGIRLDAYLGPMRITRVARYLSEFTVPPAPLPGAQGSLAPGQYAIQTPYIGECNVVCLDDAAGVVHNDLILRTITS